MKVQEIIERDGLLANATAQGMCLVAAIRDLKSSKVAEVRSLGLMIGIQLKEGFLALEMVKRLMGRGLLCIPAGEHVIRLLPPLNIGDRDRDAAMDILRTELS